MTIMMELEIYAMVYIVNTIQIAKVDIVTQKRAHANKNFGMIQQLTLFSGF